MKPLRNNIIIKRTQAETKSAGGIILTEQAQEVPTEGVVVACGAGLLEGGERQPVDVNIGDLVLFPRFAGSEIHMGGETHVIMKDTEVLCIVKEARVKRGLNKSNQGKKDRVYV
tara:strand:+ start:90 stop:431 length:342 start_codon:yes stop_codon:yes gene_type:complete